MKSDKKGESEASKYISIPEGMKNPAVHDVFAEGAELKLWIDKIQIVLDALVSRESGCIPSSIERLQELKSRLREGFPR